MEEHRARHIADIIKERSYHGARGLGTVPAPKHDFIVRAQRMLHPVLAGVLDALATIGWFVTLPFIPHDDRPTAL